MSVALRITRFCRLCGSGGGSRVLGSSAAAVHERRIHGVQYDRTRHAADPQRYHDVFQRARAEPEEFWAEQAENVHWTKPWNRVLDQSHSIFPKWFLGGELNVCYNAVDRHVEAGLGEHPAIVYDSPVTEVIQTITFKQLQSEVSRLAGVLSSHGVQKGDRVLIYMPMIPQAMAAMLACARIGAIHSLVFGGFASKELATRIAHCKPTVILSASCGIEPSRLVPYKPLLDAAIEMSGHTPKSCIIYNRTSVQGQDAMSMVPGRDYYYEEEMSHATPHDCVPVDAMHPLYVLYTSGTTGIPKAVVRPSGGHTVMLNWSMWNIYGLKPQETWFAGSDLGWVVGHSYITYAPLIHGNTTVLFEGKPIGTPDAGTYFRILQDHGVAGMFVAPTAIRALRREDPEGSCAKKYNFDNFRYLFVAGEYCDHETQEWARHVFRAPVLDNWWQTETGSAITATCVGLGNDLYPPAGFAGKPVPGWDVQVLPSQDENQADEHVDGIVVKLPLPPGAFSTLYQAEERYVDTYFSKYPGYYDTMDSGFLDADGNVAVVSRTDDVINVAGHRLSSGQLEEAIIEHEDIVEAAVVPMEDTLKGHVPLGLVVCTTAGSDKPNAQLKAEVIDYVRMRVGPVASFKDVVIVTKLPKTRSGKVARGTIAAMIAGKPYKVPVTIEDASVYPLLIEVLRRDGYTAVEPEASS